MFRIGSCSARRLAALRLVSLPYRSSYSPTYLLGGYKSFRTKNPDLPLSCFRNLAGRWRLMEVCFATLVGM
jgi:hypothetical protein